MKRMLIGATLSLGLALVASQASARSYQFHGSVCAPIAGAQDCVDYTQFGVHNICPSPVTVECPLPISWVSSTPNVFQTYFVGYDRSTLTNLDCTLQKTDINGGVLYSATLSVTSTGPSIKTFFPNVSQQSVWRLRCTIPGVQGGQFSHLASMFVGTNESP